MCPGSLAYRIGMIERHISTLSIEETTLMPILRVLVDPAVLYTAVLCPALICFLNSNTGEVVVVDMAVPIMSIAFYMVLIRIAINRNRRFSAIPKRTTSDAQQGDSQQYPMKSLQFHVSQFTHSDGSMEQELKTGHRYAELTLNEEPCRMWLGWIHT